MPPVKFVSGNPHAGPFFGMRGFLMWGGKSVYPYKLLYENKDLTFYPQGWGEDLDATTGIRQLSTATLEIPDMAGAKGLELWGYGKYSFSASAVFAFQAVYIDDREHKVCRWWTRWGVQDFGWDKDKEDGLYKLSSIGSQNRYWTTLYMNPEEGLLQWEFATAGGGASWASRAAREAYTSLSHLIITCV